MTYRKYMFVETIKKDTACEFVCTEIVAICCFIGDLASHVSVLILRILLKLHI